VARPAALLPPRHESAATRSPLLFGAARADVCVGRQYCAYARIVRGQKMYDFFSSLVARRLATPYWSARRRARIYHVRSKPLYSAIAESNNRNRKPVTLARAIERLMVLDAVIAEPKLQWLGCEREKVEYFRRRTPLRLDELPSLSFGSAPKQTTRYFPDKLPIGITDDQRTHVFLYLVNRETPVDFRSFLHRHAELFRALSEWELRLLVPRHLTKAAPLFEGAARQELGMPLHPRSTSCSKTPPATTNSNAGSIRRRRRRT
jgi:hypothetical protein